MFSKLVFCLITLSLFVITINAQSVSETTAVVNGRKITQKEVDDSVAGQLLPMQQQIFALRKAALENLITKALLEGEAKKRGISVEKFRKSLTAQKVEVSQSEVEKAYIENASAFAQMSPDEAKERLRLDMETQAKMRLYRKSLNELREQAKVEIKLADNSVSKINVNTDGPSTGAKQALVTVVEFSDFQCPYCKEFSKIKKQILQEYGSSVNFVFKHLPSHQMSIPAARASFCAGKQSRFWEYHDSLFATENISENVLLKNAEEIGLDIPAFKECADSEDSRQIVMKDIQEAKRLGIDGTPTFIVNGKMFRGLIGLEDFKQIIESELKVSQKSFGK